MYTLLCYKSNEGYSFKIKFLKTGLFFSAFIDDTLFIPSLFLLKSLITMLIY